MDISTISLVVTALIVGWMVGYKMAPAHTKVVQVVKKVIPGRKLKAYSPKEDAAKTLTNENFTYFD